MMLLQYENFHHTKITRYGTYHTGMGEGDNEYLDSVEVLDLTSNQWSLASPFPLPVTFMSTAVCQVTDRLYLLGG